MRCIWLLILLAGNTTYIISMEENTVKKHEKKHSWYVQLTPSPKSDDPLLPKKKNCCHKLVRNAEMCCYGFLYWLGLVPKKPVWSYQEHKD